MEVKLQLVQNFLNAVNPKYAVISVGKGNDYGHPTESTLNRLKDKNITLFRTDENGTIVATSNGKEIKFNCNPASFDATNAEKSTGKSSEEPKQPVTEKPSEPQPQTNTQNNNQSTTVYITKTGKKYHNDGCASLSKSKSAISLDDAKAKGYGTL